MKNYINIAIFTLLILFGIQSYAAREITITEGHVERIPIAINSFSSDNQQAGDFAKKLVEVISNDLNSSSFFKLIPSAAFIENKIGVSHKPLFSSWRQIKAQILLNGNVSVNGNKLEISFIIWDPTLEKDIHKEILELPIALWRRASHKIADCMYERITGDKGYFDTRIAYISEYGSPLKRVKRLAVMDFDGDNHKFLTDGKHLVLTPRFSPKGDKILYLSYINRTPRVYLKDIKTGRESVLGDFPGISFAPKFSPDGTKALFSVAKNGATNIFEIDLRSKKVRKLTDGFTINTSPTYSPDGKRIAFNSNRSGSRQIYVMDSDGSNIQRISFGAGSYTTPTWSPNGEFIAFTKMGSGFAIGVMRPDGSDERIITNGYLVEGPTWSPSGRLIMFTREEKAYGNTPKQSNIYYIDLSGYNEHKIRTPKDASDPEWSNLLD